MSNYEPSEFYKKIAKKYHWFFSSWDDVMDRQMNELIPILEQHKIRTVLDCACGTGLQSIGLAKAGYEITGSDLSEEMLDEARKNANKEGLKISFIQSDFRELDENICMKFDSVICMGNSIAHLLNNEEILTALNSIYNRINDDGLAIFEIRDYEKMISSKQKFLPMRIHDEKDGNFVSVLYVFDYLENIIRFNIVYLIEEKISKVKKMEVEIVDYNPISSTLFIELLEEVGFKNVNKKENGHNIQFIAKKK